MAGRQSRGRQRVPIRLIENQDDLFATFSKRRLGLYKKAGEISTLCDADVGLIIFSPTNNPFSFWHPTLESVIGRYRNPNQSLDCHARSIEANTRGTIQHCNVQLDEVLDEKEDMKSKLKELNEVDMNREKGWWERTPVENLNRDQVKQWMAQFEDYDSKVKRRIEELQNGALDSKAIQQQMVIPSSNPPPVGTMAWPSHFHGQQKYYKVSPQPSQFHGQQHYYKVSPQPSQFNGQQQYYKVPPQVNLPYVGGVPSQDQVQYYPSSVTQPLRGPGGPGSHDFLQYPGQFNYFSMLNHDPSTGVSMPSTSHRDRETLTRLGTGEAGPSRGRDINP